MNDNSFGTNFGPSTVGAINLISGVAHFDQTFSLGLSARDRADLSSPGDTARGGRRIIEAP